MKVAIVVKRLINHRSLGSHSGGYENYTFWDITPCNPLKAKRRFGGTVFSIFRIEEKTKQVTSMKAGGKQNLFFDPEDGGDIFLRNIG
jgi:hypothetical protein